MVKSMTMISLQILKTFNPTYQYILIEEKSKNSVSEDNEDSIQHMNKVVFSYTNIHLLRNY